jgi:ATP-dependent HslUV protease ATP-binding subunit HslU
MTSLLEDVLFDAPDVAPAGNLRVDRALVESRLSSIAGNRDLSRYIL